MQKYQLLTGLVLATALVMQSAQAQSGSVEDLEQRMLDACPAMWEDITADIDAAAVTGDVWQGDTADRDVFIQFMTSAMGPDAPDSAGLNAMADDISTVGAECATQRIGLLDALLQKLPQDAMTALSAVSDQLQGLTHPGVPDGMVGFFAGSACPAGWEEYTIADGRFIIATGTLGSDTYNLGDTGGSARHTLTISEMPRHRHEIRPSWGSGSTARIYYDGGQGTRSGADYTEHTGGNQPHENRPPYIALTACHKGPISCITQDETETFGSGTGSFTSWSNVSGDDHDWTINSGNTPSNDVGPTDDQAGGGFYAYTEASSPVVANEEFHLESTSLPPSCNTSVSFYYNKRGDNMGDLYLEKSVDGGAWTEIWSHTVTDVPTGSSDSWRFVDSGVDADLSFSESSPVKLRFRAVMPSSEDIWNSDIGVDTIRVQTN